LNLPKIDAKYIMEHWHALTGKHLKTLAQCMPLVLWDLVEAEMLEVWVTIGLTGALLWQYNIEVKDIYLLSKIAHMHSVSALWEMEM
ncbi:hypothetical protein DACRYDRAFT_59430, partial [Dacryopinax primogenitus]